MVARGKKKKKIFHSSSFLGSSLMRPVCAGGGGGRGRRRKRKREEEEEASHPVAKSFLPPREPFIFSKKDLAMMHPEGTDLRGGEKESTSK